MYIKLMRFDGMPIWINAAFVVTVEPRRQGGSIVVPIGDGLDYEVRESPETVLSLLEGAPAANVVPVPVPKALTPTPDDVSGEQAPVLAEEADEPEAAPVAKPHKRQPKGKKKEIPDDVFAGVTSAPKKRAVRSKTKKAELTDEQVGRLVKMAPGSKKKLLNTLATQFKVEAPEDAIDSLVKKGVLALDQNRVNWK